MGRQPEHSSTKPVYYAGEGFDDQPPRRRGLFLWLSILLLALLAIGGAIFWLHARQTASFIVHVDSQPPGASVLLDMQPTEYITPARIELKAKQATLLQVRTPGMNSDPMAVQLSVARDTSLCFVLTPLPPTVVTPAESRQTNAGSVRPENVVSRGGELALLEARLGVDLDVAETGTRIQASAPVAGQSRDTQTRKPKTQAASRFDLPTIPAERPVEQDPPAQETRQGRLRVDNWRDAFRLRLDDREIGYQGEFELVPGPHRLTIDLDRQLLLDTLMTFKPGEVHALQLPGEAHFVSLITLPVEGEIVSGDEVLGTGTALISRSRLPMEIHFMPVKGFLEPATLVLSKRDPLEVEAFYIEEQTLSWDLRPSEHQLRAIAAGYYLPGQGFVADRERGPQTDGERLLLGRAFHDRRPGGSQQIEFLFVLPEGVHEGMPARLRLRVADSEDSFPMQFTDLATLTVELNGQRLADDVTLGQETETRNWPISRMIHSGENRLSLRNTERATSASAIYSVEVELKR